MKDNILARKVVSCILVAILILMPSLIPFEDARGQSLNLIVSAAQNSQFQNHFFGPQIVQVVIDDPGAREPDRSTSGLEVKGMTAKRVHLTDGQWYHFFAEANAFAIFLDVMTDGMRDNKIAVISAGPADSNHPSPITIGTGSYTITFGASSANTFVREITRISGSVFVEVARNNMFPTLPDPFLGTSVLNPDVELGDGGDGPNTPCVIQTTQNANTCDWPFIALIGINELDQVSVRVGTTSVTLTYDDFAESISASIDRSSYPKDAEVIVSYTDFMWNINPVEEDVVNWVMDKSTGIPTKVLYRPTRNFQPSFAPDLLPVLFRPSLNFDSRQILEVDSEGMSSLKFFEQFDTATGQVTPAVGGERRAENARLISEAPFTSPSKLPVITMIERDPNVSLFESIEEQQGSRSGIFAGKSDMVANFDYFDIISSAASAFHDAFVSIDKEIYDSADRATFTITDQDLNQRSTVSEQFDGVLSKAFIRVGNPFPLANNPTFNTLPKVSGSDFASNSIQAVKFAAGAAGTAEKVDFDQNGSIDFSANSGDITNLSPAKTDLLALDFSTTAAPSFPTGIVVNSAFTLADINDIFQFTMTKNEITTKADPFIQQVSKFNPSLAGASDNDQIQVRFPKYNLVQVDVRHVKLQGQFAKIVVEVEAVSGANSVSQIVDFDPSAAAIDHLNTSSGIGSFKAVDLIDSAIAINSNLSSWKLKFTVLFLTSANTPIGISSDKHQVILDVIGIGIIRAEGQTKDFISLNAFSNVVYRPELKEQGENSSVFTGRIDLMTVLHSDTLKTIRQTIVTIGDPIKVWLPNRFIPPNRLAVSYTDVDVTGTIRQVSGTFVYVTKDGQVSWDRTQYRFSQVSFLTLVDQDLNRRPDAVEQYNIPQDGFMFFEFGKRRADTECQNVTPMPNGCFARFIESTLRETGPNTGIFKAQITMPREVLLEDGKLFRTFQSDIQANYIDVRDESSNVQKFFANAVIRSDIDTTTPIVEPPTETPSLAQLGSKIVRLDKASYHTFSRIHISLVDPDKDIDRFRSDVIFVNVVRASDTKGISNYKLIEDGFNSGNFTGYITLQGPNGRDGGIGPRDGHLGVRRDDSINISYSDLSLTVPIQYHDAIVFWEKGEHDVGDEAVLHVIDDDMNKNPDLKDEISVKIQVNTRAKEVKLTETGVNTGRFSGSIKLVGMTASEAIGEVAVKAGDVIKAIYKDDTLPSPSSIIDHQKGITESQEFVAETLIEFAVSPMERVQTKRPLIVDANGTSVSRMNADQTYSVEMELSNNTESPIELVYLLLVKDSSQITVQLSVVQGTIDPGSKDRLSQQVRLAKDQYAIEAYIWDGIEHPTPLSNVQKVAIRVG